MNDLNAFFEEPVFSLSAEEKRRRFTTIMQVRNQHHFDHCAEYRSIWTALGMEPASCNTLEDMPFLPTSLFKQYDLKSVPDEAVVKTMTSSGTSGQAVSRIFLDKEAARLQSKTLTKIMSDFLGTGRRPMLVLDSQSVVRAGGALSARGAGVLGFSILGKRPVYALDDQMQLDLDVVTEFLETHQGKPLLLFGFTYIVWQHFYQALKEKGVKLEMPGSVLMHGGGWKKMQDLKIDNDTYKKELRDVCGIEQVFNYYGMIEQTGSIYVECEHGRLHCSNFSDVIIRRPDFSVCEPGEPGLIQTLSLLPESYSGHNLMTEDMGELLGEDDCPCGRSGKTFAVHGRAFAAEIRGCSDTFAAA
ncbi:MAG: hypothetical protein JJ957_18980 [Pseudomonadales bacterium]|nr:hypothetical protein [Pseudomonadales bacterium]MBO6597579.1 hypothetical protein [Pseudomonadales bacterium]MBO6824371.1 hypothetical protein [Pseudomonadales bacterium]